jgi:hypothetical protein
MARTSPEITVKELYENARQSAPVALSCDVAEMIKSMLAQGKLEVKDGKITPKGE